MHSLAAQTTDHRPPGQPLTLDGVTHSYGEGLAVDNVTLEVHGGELIALLGPSGCGKSTLLRIIAGFLRQAEGRVIIGNAAVDDVPPNRRGVGIVFQNYALFPHMTVAENIAYGLAARGDPAIDRNKRVQEMLRVVRMQEFGDRKPRQLSGGQQQRVALARALAVQPRILLLDEPFAALDKNLRLDMQIEIKRLQRQFGLTAILVTHDQDEAMSIADRIAVMNRGRIEQLGTPVDIYDAPQTLFVNDFIGSSNIFAGKVETLGNGDMMVRLEADGLWTVPRPPAVEVGQSVLVSVRPEQLALVGTPDRSTIPVRPVLSLPMGGELVHDVETATGKTLKIIASRKPGTPVHVPAQAFCGLAPHARPSVFPQPAAT